MVYIKTKLICIGVFLSALNINAQEALTASGINATIGEKFTLGSTKTSTNPNVSVGNAGLNQEWDFSQLTYSTSDSYEACNIATSPYASTFGGANLVWEASSNSSFSKNTNDAVQTVGVVLSASGYTFTYEYTDYEDLLRFPMEYEASYTDKWAATLTSTITYIREGKTTVTADGFGTLKTATDTYTNVMRVHFVQEYSDSIPGVDSKILYKNDEYIWYKNGIHYPIIGIASLTTNSYGSPYTYYTTSFLLNQFNNINDVTIEENAYPNPTADKITFRGNIAAKTSGIIIFNQFGSQVKTVTVDSSSSTENGIQVDVNELPSGVYFAKLTDTNGNSVSRPFTVKK